MHVHVHHIKLKHLHAHEKRLAYPDICNGKRQEVTTVTILLSTGDAPAEIKPWRTCTCTYCSKHSMSSLVIQCTRLYIPLTCMKIPMLFNFHVGKESLVSYTKLNKTYPNFDAMLYILFSLIFTSCVNLCIHIKIHTIVLYCTSHLWLSLKQQRTRGHLIDIEAFELE